MPEIDVQLSTIVKKIDRLAKGGQGTVYRVRGLTLPDVQGSLVYKEYHAGQAPSSAITGIIQLRASLDHSDRTKLDQLAVWPCRVVRAEGEIVGILMSEIDGSYFQKWTKRSGATMNSPRELQYLFARPEREMARGRPAVTLKQRLGLCRSFADALAFLHEHGIIFGDVNAKNGVFRLDPVPTVLLVDCDAVRKLGSGAVVAQLNAPDWLPPEGGHPLTVATDDYKLALFILRALAPGEGCSTSVDPSRADAVLDDEGKILIRKSLEGPVKDRPSSAEWRDYLGRLLLGRQASAQGVDGSARLGPKQGQPHRKVTSLTKPRVTNRTTGWRRDKDGKWVPNN